jgi:hypothetical protein
MILVGHAADSKAQASSDAITPDILLPPIIEERHRICILGRRSSTTIQNMFHSREKLFL